MSSSHNQQHNSDDRLPAAYKKIIKIAKNSPARETPSERHAEKKLIKNIFQHLRFEAINFMLKHNRQGAFGLFANIFIRRQVRSGKE